MIYRAIVVFGVQVAPTQLEMEPCVLAGKTLMQHLVLEDCSVSGGAAGVAQLLSHLQIMQQLTHLNLWCSLTDVDVGSDSGGESEPEAVTRDEDVTPPASAYSALTASTKLQLLDIRSCALPTGVWQHMFPVGRQLPYLTSLDISGVTQEPTGTYAPAPEGRLLVRCCTGLQDLEMQRLQYSAEQLPALQGLNRLLRLSLHVDDAAAFTNLCQLTGLRGLNVTASDETDELLFQLTQLQQLTGLFFNKQLDDWIELICEVGEPLPAGPLMPPNMQGLVEVGLEHSWLLVASPNSGFLYALLELPCQVCHLLLTSVVHMLRQYVCLTSLCSKNGFVAWVPHLMFDIVACRVPTISPSGVKF